MQPYQQAGEEIQEQRTRPFKTAAMVGSAIASRALPFLNTYIPLQLAVKGLNKIDPRFGRFMSEAVKMGYGLDKIKDFIKGKVSPEKEEVQSQEAQQPAKEQRNIIEQYSPDLHQFIDQQIKSGRSPIEAGAIAQNDKKFQAIINKLSKDHKAPWSSILQSIYGNGQTAQPQQGQGIQAEQVDPMLQELIDQGTGFMNKFKGK